MKKSPGYKEAIEEIEAIVHDIEQETVDVDVLTAKVKRAAHLIKLCKKKLRASDTEVRDILKGLEKNGETES